MITINPNPDMTTPAIYGRGHIQCIREHSERLKELRYEYLRLCGFINDGDLPWILTAIRFIMDHQELTIDEAVKLFLKRIDFYAKAVSSRPTSLVPQLDELSRGVQCEHVKAEDSI